MLGCASCLQSAECRSDHDGSVFPIVAELCEQLSDLQLHQVQHLLVLDGIGFVHEHHDVLHADLPRQQEVLTGLRHLTIGRGHHQDATIKLSRSSDHVLQTDEEMRAYQVHCSKSGASRETQSLCSKIFHLSEFVLQNNCQK